MKNITISSNKTERKLLSVQPYGNAPQTWSLPLLNIIEDDVSMKRSNEVRSKKFARHFISFIKNNQLTSFQRYSLF